MKCKLSDLSDFIMESAPFEEASFENYVSTESMIADRGGISAPSSLPMGGSIHIYKPGDILISNIRPYFKKIWRADKDGTCSNDVLVIRSNGKCDSTYLYYVLSSDDFFNYMTATSKGTKMPRGDKETLKNYEINLPPLEKQTQIASILSSIDDLIQVLSEINDYLTHIQSEIIKNYNSTHCCTERSIYDLILIKYGSPFKSSMFSEDEGIDLIRIRDLKTDRPQIKTAESIDGMEYVCPGDVVVSMDAEFRPHIWTGKKGLLNQRVCKLTPNQGYSAALAFYYLKDPLSAVESYKTGTTVSHIGKSDFDSMVVKMPSDCDLHHLSDIVNPLYSLYVKNGNSIQMLTGIRDCLLAKLFDSNK